MSDEATPDPATAPGASHPGFAGTTSDADSGFEPAAGNGGDGAGEPAQYCVWQGIQYGAHSVVCMDDKKLHECLPHSTGAYWSGPTGDCV